MKRIPATRNLQAANRPVVKEKFIIAHDMGTSSDKAVLLTVYGEIVKTARKHYPLYHPQPTYAEQDPMDWWEAICETTHEVLARSKVQPRDVVGVTFSTQTQNLIPVTEEGKPLCRSLSWLDGRSADIINEILWTPPRLMGYNIPRLIKFLSITGGAPGHTGKDQIGKILWLRRHEPEIFARTHKFLDGKDFLIYQLTGNMVTSVDLAVIWWMLDTRKNRNQWHPGLCALAGIDVGKLPEVHESAAIVGTVTKNAAKQIGLLLGTPVINGAADLSSTALGSGAIGDGEMHVNIGTSSWVAGHFTKRKIDLAHYTGCIGSTYPQKYYLGMAHQETAGVCLEWLKDSVVFADDHRTKGIDAEDFYAQLNTLAERAPAGAEGLMFTPWMFGERSPLDDDTVRAGFFNLSLHHSRKHFVRAMYEGIAFNSRWALETLESLYHEVPALNFTGGAAQSEVWCQILADVMNKEINQVADPRLAGAKGVALLASMTLGFIGSYQEIRRYVRINKTFYPDPRNRALYDRLFVEFKNLYKHNKKWFARMNSSR